MAVIPPLLCLWSFYMGFGDGYGFGFRIGPSMISGYACMMGARASSPE